MDITQHILDEHHQQRQMFADLDEADRDDPDAMASLWEGLTNFLEVHAAAEEAVFYHADGVRAEDKDPDRYLREHP